jgi:hypothetical protein
MLLRHQANSSNMGARNAGMDKLRSQSRAKVIRTLYLCDECFESLPEYQLHDLFLRFAPEQK